MPPIARCSSTWRQVTGDATRVDAATITTGLREAGFDDRGILQITLIAAWFNYINRVADALGVGRRSPFRLFRVRRPVTYIPAADS